MEARIGGELHNFYGPAVLDMNSMGKKSTEWDLNEWGWDGDLFVAAPVNPVPGECRSRQFLPVGSDVPANNGALLGYYSESGEMVVGNEGERRDLEKRRRVVEVEREEVNEEAGSLNLKLGGQVYPVQEREVDRGDEKSGKKAKTCGTPSSRAVCQVEDCKADLSNAKDYHRRHKVCQVHSKANWALVGNVMQRFCQQCSRFHVLQEFDEGKRSCRRRLAGHNKRRRKTHPENVVNSSNLNDEQARNYLVISLLRIISNLHTDSPDQPKNKDLIPHLLSNIANLANTSNERNPTGMQPEPQDLRNVGTSSGTTIKDFGMPAVPGEIATASDLAHKRTVTDSVQGGVKDIASAPQQPASLFPDRAGNSNKENGSVAATVRTRLNNIDLNNVYDGSQDCFEDLQNTVAHETLTSVSPVEPLWLHKDSQQSSPPQTSGNTGSTTSQSLSTSSGETQSRTDRIVFKLFGKDPSDLPLVLRKQLRDWLSGTPSEVEGYIRPGCIILTVYIRMDKSTWEELYSDLPISLRRLLDSSSDPFWRTGWIYTRVRHHVTFVYNGQVVLEKPLSLKNHRNCRISSIKPIAVSVAEGVNFVIKGFNLFQSASRLLCSFEGKYLVQENFTDLTEGADSVIEHDEIQTLSFPCVIPNTVGRGFIEIEDHGLGSSFFPFIVAEEDVCSEIRTLESIIELAEAADMDSNELKANNQALDFIHEIGWLLHKCRLKLRLEAMGGDDVDLFSFKRFRWLIEFAVDRDWCAVINKLLNILFDGIVDVGPHASILLALLEIGLLHQAVRRNSRSLVEFLLEYHRNGASETKPEDKAYYLFRPDTTGPGGLTPLHIAASLEGSENVVDALTEDPGMVGIEAWKNARDSSGLTPHDYACLRGHRSYVHLVQRKLNKKSGNPQVVLDIPGTVVGTSIKQKIANTRMSGKLAVLQTEKTIPTHCSQCEQKLAYASPRGSINIYRPAMLSMLAIAAVCVCAALLFKSSPEVFCSFRPFRWERLEYGSQ